MIDRTELSDKEKNLLLLLVLTKKKEALEKQIAELKKGQGSDKKTADNIANYFKN